MLRTDTLEKSTLALLRKLQSMEVFKDTRLVGGTALTLQLGHRLSVDLDLFGAVMADANELSDELRTNGFNARLDHSSKNIKQYTINAVKVDFVAYPYIWLEPAKVEDGIRLAGLKDIAAMKLEAITNRGTRRDFVDVFFLLKHFSINQQIELYLQKYPDGSSFNVLRSLSYFEDAETDPMPKMLEAIDWDHVKSYIREIVVSYQ
jgi:predicted nucleotidyltransferase component of viral defense system